MVALSLYRGNLHRVAHLNVKWNFPNKPPISFKDFSRLVRKRHRSLSRIPNPNPNPNPNPRSEHQAEEFVGENGCSDRQKQGLVSEIPNLQSREPICGVVREEINNGGDSNEVEKQEQLVLEEVRGDGDGDGDGGGDGTSEAAAEEGREGTGKADLEPKNDTEVLSGKDKKKQELEEKLQHLNEKKHNMVQMLKQILHAEEEMKKRNSMPAAVVRSPNPSQVETMNDAGATPKHAINRMGSEGNSSGDLEGESEDASNHTAHARHRQQMSPSTSSPLRRPSHGSLQHNAVPHSTRPSLGASGHGQTTSTHMGVTASPSRFAPFGHQSHSAGLPPLAISGTPFTASSPSPAGSGGSSVFRDPRWTSPTWN